MTKANGDDTLKPILVGLGNVLKASKQILEKKAASNESSSTNTNE